MQNKSIILLVSLVITVSFKVSESTHIKGSFRSNDFFKFLIKFGFQKTDRHLPDASHGYIFGNITSQETLPTPITFAVLDRPYFLEYYENRVLYNKQEACKRMFSKLSKHAFDPTCNPHGKDYLRRVPCPKGKICIDEDVPWNVVKNNQFTYVLQDFKQPS